METAKPGPPKSPPRLGYGVGLVAVLGLVLTALVTFWLDRVTTDLAERSFRQRTRNYRTLLDHRFESLVTRLALARDLARHGEALTPEDWDRWFTANIRSDFNEIVSFGYLTAVRPTDLAAHEQQVRGLYCPEYVVHPQGRAGQRHAVRGATVGGEPWMLVLSHLVYGNAAPMERTPVEEMLAAEVLTPDPRGIDEGQVRATLHQAIDSGTAAVTGGLQATEGGAPTGASRVVQVYLPVFSSLPGREHPADLNGVLLATLNFEVTAARYFGTNTPMVGARILAEVAEGVWEPLATTDRLSPAPSTGRTPRFTATAVQRLYGRPLRWEFWTTPAFERVSDARLPWVAAVAGLAFTLVVTGLVWSQGRSRQSEAATARALEEASTRLAEVNRERERLSRDLHDGTIQSIYALGLDLQRVRRLIDRDPAGARAELTRTLGSLNNVVAELREFILQMEPAANSSQNLESVLQAFLNRLRRTTDVEITLDLDPETSALLPPRQVLEVLQIVREAVANSLRHGQPRQIGVALSRDARDWRLTVADDGAGFDPARATFRGGHGLRNLTERAAELGGECQILSAPGTGAAVRVVFPALAPSRPVEVEPLPA